MSTRSNSQSGQNQHNTARPRTPQQLNKRHANPAHNYPSPTVHVHTIPPGSLNTTLQLVNPIHYGQQVHHSLEEAKYKRQLRVAKAEAMSAHADTPIPEYKVVTVVEQEKQKDKS